MKRVTWGFTVLVAPIAALWSGSTAPGPSRSRKSSRSANLGSKVGVLEGSARIRTGHAERSRSERKGGVLGKRSRSSRGRRNEPAPGAQGREA